MTDAAAIFLSAWDTYRKVVAGDYMFHREIGAEVRAALRARFQTRPFALLDLGCGDGSALVPLLSGLALKRYVGVDLSRPALALAESNLAVLGCPVVLEEEDMMAALEKAEPTDVVYSSFALHHLPTERKAEFFRRVADKLAPGGLLLLVDVTREEGEPLDLYRRRYCAWMRETWTGLAPQEREAVCEHLAQNDMPEPYSTLRAQAESAGLSPISNEARHKWHRLMSFAPN